MVILASRQSVKLLMTTVKKGSTPLKDISITDHYALESPYNVPPTPAKSTGRQQAQMHDIAAVQRYYGINHPILSRSKKQLIQEKLKLDEQVREQFKARIRDDNLMAKYLHNPFSVMKDARIPSPNEVLQEEQRRKQRAKANNQRHFLASTKSNIIQAVNELTHTNFERDPSAIRRSASHIVLSSKLIKNVSQSQLRMPVPVAKKKVEREGVTQWSLDDVVAMNDENYFAAKLENINIFQIMRGNHRPILTRECLDKYHFSFTHMVERIDSLKFPFLRDLSRIGRSLALDRPSSQLINRLDYISSHEMAVNYGDIRIQDLLSMASGRFNPEIAYTAANQGDVRRDFSPTSSQVSQAEILYDSRVRHQGNNCQNPLQARHQIQAYHFIENSPQQAKFERFCARIYGNVKSDMQLKANLVKNTIQDKRMHGKITAAVQENIGYLANLNNRRKGTPTDRIISQNKINKNRKETLQIRHLIQSIQLKNREEEKIQQLLNPNKRAT